MLRNWTSRLLESVSRFVKIIAPLITLVTIFWTVINGFFGSGFLLQLFEKPQVVYSKHQLMVDSIVLSRCLVENLKNSNANELTIEVRTENQTPIVNYEISGAERNWVIIEGGQQGDTFITIELDRLVFNNPIMVTIATSSETRFQCQVNSSEGPAPSSEQSIELSPFISQLGILAIIILVSLNLFSIRTLIYRIERDELQRNESGD